MSYRAKLVKEAAELLAARDRIGDRAFKEGREPTREEWRRMENLQRRHDEICRMRVKFFPSGLPLPTLELKLH